MTDRTRSLLVLLPRLSVTALAALSAATWQRLPRRLAVHFGGGAAPDGRMSRWQFAAFAAGTLALLRPNFTGKPLSVREADKFLARLLFSYAGTIILPGAFASILRHNV